MNVAGDPLPTTASFGSGALPIAVIVVWYDRGGWHAGTVLYRKGNGPVTVQPPWEEPFWGTQPESWDQHWEYLSERVSEGRSSNGYNFDIEAFEVADTSHITPLVTARAAEVVAASNGPFGEIAGTFLVDESSSVRSVVMPFVLLPDDRGHDALVATTALADLGEGSVRVEHGLSVEVVGFESVEHWQRQGAPSWPLQRDVPYIVEWNGNQVRFVVAEGGGFAEVGLIGPPKLGAEEELTEKTGTSNSGLAQPVPTFAIQRVPEPEWISRELPLDHLAYEDATGEQLEWSFATPWVFRALASPLTHEPILAAPQRRAKGSPFAYWSALLNLLIYSFGWARPDRGLLWWYDAGKPTDDPRLQLLSQVWDADGQLDWFAAWLWTTPSIFDADLLSDLTGYHDDRVRVPVDECWIETTRSEAAASGIAAPCGDGGWDELHLSMHSSGPLREIAGAPPTLLRGPRSERRATLMLDSMIGWYSALAVHGSSLPTLAQRSWRVDVVVRPVGRPPRHLPSIPDHRSLVLRRSPAPRPRHVEALTGAGVQ